MKFVLSLFFCFGFVNVNIAQVDSVLIELKAELEFPDVLFQLKSSIASRIDKRNNGYLYSSNLNFGLGIYSIEDPSEIELRREIGISEFNELSVSTCQQIDDLLFVGLGDFQKENEASGLAILNITDPENPILQDVWTSEDYSNGVSHLDVYDNIVYLSMMNDGLLILDATDASDVKFVSHIVPDLTFPTNESEHYQGRGIDKKGDLLYYTFDRGGFRAIDVSDIANPVEVEKYINQDLIDKAVAAYNDVLVIGDYAYVSVDYCGMEVIDISTSPWTLVEWYDPVDCQGFNWFGADVHTNELVSACNDSLLFVSGGNSEVVVFDISDPSKLKKIGGFFELDNELAAYGLHVLDDKISVSYISNPLNIPYVGNWGGLKILSFSKLKTTGLTENQEKEKIDFFPNPIISDLFYENPFGMIQVGLYTVNGQFIKQFELSDNHNGYLDLSTIPLGTYLLKYVSKSNVQVEKIIKI